MGLDGVINIGPKATITLPELPDLVERALRLQNAGLVKVQFEDLPAAPIVPQVEVPVAKIEVPVEVPLDKAEESAPAATTEEDAPKPTRTKKAGGNT